MFGFFWLFNLALSVERVTLLFHVHQKIKPIYMLHESVASIQWIGCNGDLVGRRRHPNENKFAFDVCQSTLVFHLFQFIQFSFLPKKRTNLIARSAYKCKLCARFVSQTMEKKRTRKKWSENCIFLLVFQLFYIECVIVQKLKHS